MSFFKSRHLIAAGVALCTALIPVGAAIAEGHADLERVTAAWFAAINAGDNAGAREMVADDAAIIPPAGPVAVGRAEFDASVKELTATPGFHVAFTPERSAIATDGRTGFVVGASEINMPAVGGGRKLARQRLLIVWRKDAAGKWKCILNVVMGSPIG